MTILKNAITGVAIIGLLGACIDDGNGGTANPISDLAIVTGVGKSPSQRELSSIQRDYADARIKASLIGGGGALLACELRRFQGNPCTVRERNQAIAGGLIAGYLVGGYLTNRDASFRGTQETLQKDIQVAREDNARLSKSVATARNVVAFQESRIAELNRGLSDGTVRVAAYQAEIAQMRQDVKTVQRIRSDAQENVAGLNNSISNHSSLGTRELLNQRNSQQARINELLREENRMLANIASAPAQVRS